MKLFEKEYFEGNGILLIPYLEEHVCIYHDWMKDPFLQEMTASEPLSLEEEYEMQKSWRVDDDNYHKNYTKTFQSQGGIIGDVNLFLNDTDDKHIGELEIMIAEQDCRGKGIAIQVICMMMGIAQKHLNIHTFRAKISFQNHSSIHIFEQKLGFHVVSQSEVFQEVTLEKVVDGQDEHDLFFKELFKLISEENLIPHSF